MKIITIQANSSTDIDKKCNEFESTHKVKATQSHISLTPNGAFYAYVLFYEE